LFPLCCFCVFNRFAEHLVVEIQADFIDGAGLFAAENIARTADFQIAECQLISRAEVGVFLQCFQPFRCFFREMFGAV